MHTIKIESLDTIHQAAKEFIAGMDDRTVFAFRGSMGAGKTTFIKAICEELGVEDVINSPTFAIVHDYGGNPHLYHFDMYRISTWDDLYSTGFFDYLDMGGVLAVEWSENIENVLPESYIRIEFEKGNDENQRTIKIYKPGEANT